MKTQQAKHIAGHVTIEIKGNQPELFFRHCAVEGISVWNVKKKADDRCEGVIFLHSLEEVKKRLEGTSYELAAVHVPKGLLPAIRRLWHRKDIILTAFLCMLLLFILSNIAWKIDISGLPEETERKLKDTLEQEGLYEGAWTFNLKNVDDIQQQALHQIPELMYIGIRENGTTYHIDAIEKQQEEKTSQPPERNLVASKNGEIQRVFVKNGVSKVEVHDIVKKGDLLVSGEIEKEEETPDKKDEKDADNVQRVAAEGEIYANTWYEMEVTSALTPARNDLTGEAHTRYHLAFPDFSFPIWGINHPYKEYIQEAHTHTLRLFDYKFPIFIIAETSYEMKRADTTGNKEEAVERAVKHIEHTLQRRSGEDAEVLHYKVLHERTENGKVKINLYVSVLENIAEEQILN